MFCFESAFGCSPSVWDPACAAGYRELADEVVQGSHTPLGAKSVWSVSTPPFLLPQRSSRFISPERSKSGEPGPNGAAVAAFSGCASASGPQLPGSGLRPPQARPCGSAARLPGPRVSGTAARLGPGPLRGGPRGARFLHRPGRETKAKGQRPPSPRPRPHPGRRRRCGSRGPGQLRGSRRGTAPARPHLGRRAPRPPLEAAPAGGRPPAEPAPRFRTRALGPRAPAPPSLPPAPPALPPPRPLFGLAQRLAAGASWAFNPNHSLTPGPAYIRRPSPARKCAESAEVLLGVLETSG